MTEDNENCPNCGGPIAIRNPTGKCDHLYYPENVPGYVSERSALLRCEEALREARIWIISEVAQFEKVNAEVEALAGVGGDDVEPYRDITRTLIGKIDAALTLLDEARHGK